MVLRSAVCLLALLFLHSAALAEKRMALLIGNEGYASEIGRLSNPHNDVALLERTLKVLGFEVITVRDVGLGALTRVVNAYARRVQAAGPNAVGFFYYSGHGASDGSTNYLIPVDVKTTETGELWDQSLRLTEITRKLKTEAGNATHFVVFDACRNTLKLTQPGSRAIVQSKGFVPLTQENGMLIAYATAEGELASDVGAGACSIPTIADSDSNRLRTGIPIDRGQHSDDCGHELPSTASWVHMTRVRVKLATVGSDFWGSAFRGKAPSPYQ
jgi:uncharacterized caspase-like protein